MSTARSVRRFQTLAAVAVAALTAPAALAEDDEEGATGPIGEIVVSATYRDTRLMDSPTGWTGC